MPATPDQPQPVAQPVAPPVSPPASRPTRLASAVLLLLACVAGLAFTADRQPIAAPPTRAGAPVQPARINLNTASAAELELLPRIGPALSKRIIEDRDANGPFKSLDDLDRVRGIGPRTILNIRDHATTE